MSESAEGILAIAAALVLLFTAMLWNTVIAAGVGVVMLAAWAIYKIVQRNRAGRQPGKDLKQ
jgi:hypothetical protein